MKWFVWTLVGAVFLALLSGYVLHVPLLTFSVSALALIFLSKLMGDATEGLSRFVGQSIAGFVNVTLSNLAELIIIFVAVKSNKILLVQAGIVGSIIGNLLLVMGLSIYFGCRKHGALSFSPRTAHLFTNQFFLVAVVLLLPTLFDGSISEARMEHFSQFLAVMLVASYVYYNVMSVKDERIHHIDTQAQAGEHGWSRNKCIAVLGVSAISCFVMSELLVGEVEHVAETIGMSEMFIGFIIMPLLGNIAEHMVAVFAARKKMVDLSLAVAVGSASQVGMVVAPGAIFFGILTGNRMTLDFTGLPIELLIISIIAAFLVLRDNRWQKSEGVMLLSLYVVMVAAFIFSR